MNAPPNDGAPIVYDSARHRIVLLYSYWELDLDAAPLAWSKLATPGGTQPNLLTGEAVYDPNQDRVLFVKSADYPESLQVWQLPFASWTWSQLPSVGASPTSWNGFRAVFDATANRIVMYGGASPDPFGGPTVIVGGTVLIDVSGPTVTFLGGSSGRPRTFHSLILDTSRQRLVTFGGQDRTSTFNDVQTAPLSGIWQTPPVGGTPPSPRTFPAAIYDSDGDRMIVFGGSGNNDLWQLSLAPPMTWSPLVASGGPPSASMQGGSSVFDAAGHRMINVNSVRNDDVWALSLGGSPAWQNQSTPHPAALAGIAYESTTGSFVAQGSASTAWRLSFGDTISWSLLSPSGTPPPASRSDIATIYDPVGRRLVEFGGWQSPNYLNSSWALQLEPAAWTLLAPFGSPPSARRDAGAAYDPVRRRMLVFGGWGSSGALNDLWALTLGTVDVWNAISLSGGPSPRLNASLIYDPVRDRLIVAGGGGHQDVWIFDLGTLTWEAQIAFPAHDPVFTYDSSRDRLIGYSTTGLYDFPFAQSAGWRPLSMSGPSPGYPWHPYFEYDPITDRIVLIPDLLKGTGFVATLQEPLGVPPSLAGEIALGRCWPNPARTRVSTQLTSSRVARVRVDVVDLTGRSVRSLMRRQVPAGTSTVEWDLEDAAGRPVAPGLYWLILDAEGVRVARRLVVAR